MTTSRRVEWGEAPAYAPPAEVSPKAVAAGWMVSATFLLGLMLVC